jgi:acyl-homoserine-lactone acylase
MHSPLRAPLRALSLLALAAVGLGGCLDPIHLEPEGYQYRAVLRWTSHGIPHVLADDVPSATYGQGWAFARLNGCLLADQVLKVRSERAAFLGAGPDDAYVRSDLVLQFLGIYANAQTGIADLRARADDGDDGATEVLAAVEAYARGYNDFITARGDELPCGQEPWLRPVSVEDLFAHYIEVGMLASSRQAHEFIWAAVPPGRAGQPPEAHPVPRTTLADMRARRPGSNGWGIGKERSANGRGMVVANPHFPWEGELKLYESHLRVPGELDVYGASLMGVVGVLIGFNPDVAWTHTVSDGQRITIYQVEIDPDDPTRYIYDGESRPMEPVTHEVQVLQEDGTLAPVAHTFWRAPDLGTMVALPPLIWTTQLGYALKDANANNQQLIAQFLGMNRARSMDEFQRVHDEARGIPWVNTISASKDGRAWYIDATPTPNLSPVAIADWLDKRLNDPLTSVVDDNGFVLLPGNDSTFAWQDEPGAREPGLVPLAAVPRLERPDFVFNANDSHWLTNPLEPLEGYSPLHGFEATPRSARTRMNAVTLLDEDRSMSGPDGKFDLDELRDAALSNRGLVAELLRDQVVARCRGAQPMVYGEQTVDVTEACETIAAWDLRLDPDSVGAVVWREFLGEFEADDMVDFGALFGVKFEPTDPVGTPRELREPPDDPADDKMVKALAGATLRLRQAGIPLDAKLSDAQYTVRGGQRIPIHCGGRDEGVTNLVIYDVLKTTVGDPMPRAPVINESTGLTEDGYVVNYGSSFVMAMRFTDDAPEAWAFVTYGQSDDPRSPYHADQTESFSHKQWRQVLYTEEDIEQDPELAIEVIFGFE